jgi:uncharacterized protein YjiS (DUF1127 family)
MSIAYIHQSVDKSVGVDFESINRRVYSLFSMAGRCISEWRSRRRSRRELLSLSGRELGDLAFTRCDAIAEGSKPFWQA